MLGRNIKIDGTYLSTLGYSNYVRVFVGGKQILVHCHGLEKETGSVKAEDKEKCTKEKEPVEEIYYVLDIEGLYDQTKFIPEYYRRWLLLEEYIYSSHVGVGEEHRSFSCLSEKKGCMLKVYAVLESSILIEGSCYVGQCLCIQKETAGWNLEIFSPIALDVFIDRGGGLTICYFVGFFSSTTSDVFTDMGGGVTSESIVYIEGCWWLKSLTYQRCHFPIVQVLSICRWKASVITSYFNFSLSVGGKETSFPRITMIVYRMESAVEDHMFCRAPNRQQTLYPVWRPTELVVVTTGNPYRPVDGVSTIGIFLTLVKVNTMTGYPGVLVEDESRDPDYIPLAYLRTRQRFRCGGVLDDKI
eukprot:Gb_14309 [translate_table: standard]